ncbi:unnamed protein product [Ceratitis capitata]|uniref:(Mediterranean fruit fly) hypothetical protein n=1 Tax=Ceratitis capitata TaxID=7213 RepID=W8C5M2_CERCA|nr:unnamed protein product [Ceratitis capitata]
MLPARLYKYIENSNGTTGAKRLALNEKCLTKICGYLNIPDHVNFGLACESFRRAYVKSCMTKFEICALNHISKLTIKELVFFFEAAGPYIKHIERHAPLSKLDIVIDLIVTYCKQLRSLTLRNCNLCDEMVRKLPRLKRIDTLILCGNQRITGRYLYGLTYLKELNLCGCSNITTSQIVEAFKTCTVLKILDIRECTELHAEAFIAMAKYCEQLEVLKMSCPPMRFDCIGFLPLKELVLLDRNRRPSTTHLLEQLPYSGKQLEVLEIHSENSLNHKHISMIKEIASLKMLAVPNNEAVNDDALDKFCQLTHLEKINIRGCCHVTNNGILKLLRFCTQLHCINIQFCRLITHRLVSDVISFLNEEIENKNLERKKPLVLLVNSTLMDANDLSMCVGYETAVRESLIKVIFDISTFDLVDGVAAYHYMGRLHHSSDEGDDYEDENANPM